MTDIILANVMNLHAENSPLARSSKEVSSNIEYTQTVAREYAASEVDRLLVCLSEKLSGWDSWRFNIEAVDVNDIEWRHQRQGETQANVQSGSEKAGLLKYVGFTKED